MHNPLTIVNPPTIKHDIETIIRTNVLGTFSCIEITEIFAIDNNKDDPINIFTIMVAEDRNTKNINLGVDNYITPREGIKTSSLKGWYIGIKSYLVSVEKAINMFTDANIKRKWDSCGKLVNTPEYLYKKRTFTPPDSFYQVPLNSLLKNNFQNGSYVVELVNKSKIDFSIFFEKPSVLQELADEILKYLPIDLSSLSDRLGNILFQVPIKAIQARISPQGNSENLECNISWHPDIKPRDLMICGFKKDDDLNHDDFHIAVHLNEINPTVIPFNNNGPFQLTIWDSYNNLILHSLPPSAFIRRIGVSSNVVGNEHRVIHHEDGNSSIVPTISNSDAHYVDINQQSNLDWSKIRIYENNRSLLKESREFIQYNPKGKDKILEHDKAIGDIRYLINKYGKNGAYLWDPYLSPSDIVKTLFYSKFNNSPLKAISALKEPLSDDSNKTKKLSVFDRYHDIFNSFSAEMMLGVNLQFRSPRNNKGWKFHDRFLIFPDVNKIPMAWSLGTSVNSVGKEHHILQKCGDARLILDAFNELWDELSSDECLIWGSI
ncbi:VPA1262 family N-terminal domain-containing protein [Aeromonas salmonicida]|uniref:VPA1262 family N-terminal domain-containing protein n=1 Tax=Aeromonas salmonicida TaxID=645 RepID=UPI003D25CB34